ncbi:hypothetical protein [Promicromonospora sp. NPDC050880]|uniref:hypothetical protein n=1 Tax=Promicromonospora sp. NPDC050880 TaxID=3364406 RepID=UPI0037BBD583
MGDELSPTQAEARRQLRERMVHGQKLIAHQGFPPRTRMLPRPIPTRCTARAYDGTLVTVVGEVVGIAGPWRVFVADYPGWGTWTATVHVDTCEYLDR